MPIGHYHSYHGCLATVVIVCFDYRRGIGWENQQLVQKTIHLFIGKAECWFWTTFNIYNILMFLTVKNVFENDFGKYILTKLNKTSSQSIFISK